MNPGHRSGYVAIIGRPNVGKSTLVNALVGEKISIVTSKPNTTRHAIVAIRNRPDAQLVFIDTPGLEARSTRLMNRAMSKASVGATEASDVILCVVEAGRLTPADERALELVRDSGLPCVLAVNKIDRVHPRERLLPILDELQRLHAFAEIVPVSALKQVSLERLEDALVGLLPAGEPLYSPDTVTTRGLSFRAAELLREKLMQVLHAEVPYGLGVEIQQLREGEGDRLLVDAVIWVDRESHKGIVVGRGGRLLKKVGTETRLELERLLGRRVRLETHVKLKRNWAENASSLQQLGYDGEIG